MTKSYLGDGVYAEFDGDHVVLTTENGMGGPTNTIYLDHGVHSSLVDFLERIGLLGTQKPLQAPAPPRPTPCPKVGDPVYFDEWDAPGPAVPFGIITSIYPEQGLRADGGSLVDVAVDGAHACTFAVDGSSWSLCGQYKREAWGYVPTED